MCHTTRPGLRLRSTTADARFCVFTRILLQHLGQEIPGQGAQSLSLPRVRHGQRGRTVREIRGLRTEGPAHRQAGCCGRAVRSVRSEKQGKAGNGFRRGQTETAQGSRRGETVRHGRRETSPGRTDGPGRRSHRSGLPRATHPGVASMQRKDAWRASACRFFGGRPCMRASGSRLRIRGRIRLRARPGPSRSALSPRTASAGNRSARREHRRGRACRPCSPT